MILFIFTLLLMFSLSAVLYLIVRALPRVEEVNGPTHNGFLDRWAHSHIPEKIDEWFNSFLLKFLRKSKVSILRMDNMISGHLRKINTTTAENDKKIDFKDIKEKEPKE
jgi:hypothetical protein